MTVRDSVAVRICPCWLPAVVACLVAGCGERGAQTRAAAAPAAMRAPASAPATVSMPAPASASAPSSGPTAPPRMAVGRLLVISPAEPAQAPPEPERREPTAEYASLAAARDAIEAMLRHAVSAADTSIHFSRGAVTFEYLHARATARGLQVSVVVNDTIICPQENLLESMRSAGWVDDWSYSADGDDGTVMGLVCRQFLCVVEGRWDGGDPTDSTYVPRPGCQISATCVPRRLDDVPDR